MSKSTRHWIGILVLWNLLQTFPISSLLTDMGRHHDHHAYSQESYYKKRVNHIENYLLASNADYLTISETFWVNTYCEDINRPESFIRERKESYLCKMRVSGMKKCIVLLLAFSGTASAQTDIIDAFYQQDWFVIYLAGCVAWVVFAIFKVLLILFLQWITKGNVLAKNMAKVSEPDNTSWKIKYGTLGVIYLIEVALSWLGVVINIGHLFIILFRILREVFVSVPEEIKRLNFPLLNNPNLSREAVWAHGYALGVKAGANDPTDTVLMSESLDDVSYYYDDFNRKKSLKRLGTLNVVSDKVISSMLKYERDRDEDSTWDEDL